MGDQLVIPFTLDASGGVAYISDVNIQTAERVSAIVETSPGTRVMRPTFGVPLANALFSAGDAQAINADLAATAQQQLTLYEPGTTITSFSTSPDTDSGLVSVQIDFSPVVNGSAQQLTYQTAVIEVGGTVVPESL